MKVTLLFTKVGFDTQEELDAWLEFAPEYDKYDECYDLLCIEYKNSSREEADLLRITLREFQHSQQESQ